MEATVKKMQPLSFYKPALVPDWSTRWPNQDNVYHREKWIEGLHATSYYLDWLVNKQISLQFRVTVTTDSTLTVYKYSEASGTFASYATITPTDITPTGWVSESIYRYDWTPTEEGVYYIDSSSAGIRSNRFVVHTDLKMRRRLVHVEYYNSFNDYGIVFWDGSTQRYSPRVYFTGGLFPDAPGNDISAFERDRGEIDKQRSTPTEVMLLKIADVHYSELPRINLILACDNLTVNGISFMNSEAPQPQPIEGTDLYNVICKLTRSDYEY
jgi:hypothetical protein